MDFSKVSATNTVIATESQWEGFKQGALVSGFAPVTAGDFTSWNGDGATDITLATVAASGLTFAGAPAGTKGDHAKIAWTAEVLDSPAPLLAADDDSGDGDIADGNLAGLVLFGANYDKATGVLSIKAGDGVIAWGDVIPQTPAVGDKATLTFTVRLTATFTLGSAERTTTVNVPVTLTKAY